MMMRRIWMSVAVVIVSLGWSSIGQAQQISGDYIETRSADVYTGPCFANAEVGLVGDQAILAWRVEQGSWKNVSLAGLSVVAAVKASATLGDPFSNPYPAQAILIVDERATQEQQQALVSFAEEMGGDLIRNVIRVERAPIRLQVGHHGEHDVTASLQAGDIAAIETRPLNERDHICGNEEVYYPPLTEASHAMPAVAKLDQFLGSGLGVSWTVHGKRSAFVGHFSKKQWGTRN